MYEIGIGDTLTMDHRELLDLLSKTQRVFDRLKTLIIFLYFGQ